MAVLDATDEQPTSPSQCWCCGTHAKPEQHVHLGNNPEVAVCPRCAHWLSKRAWELQDRTRTGPLVAARAALRRARNTVVAHGWQNSRLIGPALRALGKRLP